MFFGGPLLDLGGGPGGVPLVFLGGPGGVPFEVTLSTARLPPASDCSGEAISAAMDVSSHVRNLLSAGSRRITSQVSTVKTS